MLTRLFIYFIVLLNPFSQVLLLWGVMKEHEWREFRTIYWRATLLSFAIYGLFVVTGDFLVTHVFQIRFEAVRIFGGAVILLIAYRYISDGEGTAVLFKSTVEDLAPQITLPFMVGPATIWLSIIIGRNSSFVTGLGGLAIVLLVNYLGVVGLHWLTAELQGHRYSVGGRYMGMLMRLNALFIGAIGVEMLVGGITSMVENVAQTPGV